MTGPASSPAELPAGLVERILDRLALEREAPAVEYLERVHRAFITAVPFENFSKIRKDARPIPRESKPRLPREVFEGFLGEGSGGTCFARTFAYHALLRELGFESTLHLGGVKNEHDHAATVVELEGVAWLSDVGLPLLGIAPLDAGTNVMRYPAYDVRIEPWGRRERPKEIRTGGAKGRGAARGRGRAAGRNGRKAAVRAAGGTTGRAAGGTAGRAPSEASDTRGLFPDRDDCFLVTRIRNDGEKPFFCILGRPVAWEEFHDHWLETFREHAPFLRSLTATRHEAERIVVLQNAELRSMTRNGETSWKITGDVEGKVVKLFGLSPSLVREGLRLRPLEE